MRISRRFLGDILAVAVVLSAAPKPASADTYQMFLLWSDNVIFYGMDDSGNVALDASAYCIGPNPCYDTFHNGVLTGLVVTTPGLVVNDSGTPCTPALPPGGHLDHGICNNGRDAFTGTLAMSQLYPGLYTGSYPSIATIEPGHFGEGFVFMNSNGDIVVDDVFTEDWYLFVDMTTAVPEPSSILLIGTGVLGALGVIRRQSLRNGFQEHSFPGEGRSGNCA